MSLIFANKGLKISTEDFSGKTDYLKFEGFIDKSTISDLNDFFRFYLDSLFKPVQVFDLSQLQYINSEGIGFLMMTSAHFKKTASFFIYAPSPQVLDVLQAVGLDKLIEILPDRMSLEAQINSLNI
jgi:anti-anti-sigma factor